MLIDMIDNDIDADYDMNDLYCLNADEGDDQFGFSKDAGGDDDAAPDIDDMLLNSKLSEWAIEWSRQFYKLSWDQLHQAVFHDKYLIEIEIKL